MPRRTDLPAMPLCNGCGACCGPVTARPEEVKRIRQYIKEKGVDWEPPPIEENTLSFACGFLRKQDDGSYQCAVHSVRPWTCRAFGVIEEMQCPLFPEAAVTSIPREKAVLLRLIDPTDKYLGEYFEADYLKRIGGRGTGSMLHAVAAAAIKRLQEQAPNPSVEQTEEP
jgi:Fe-S-cluster containining protein